MHSLICSFIDISESSSPVAKLVLCIRSVSVREVWTVITNLPNLTKTRPLKLAHLKMFVKCRSHRFIFEILKYCKTYYWKTLRICPRNHKKRRDSYEMWPNSPIAVGETRILMAPSRLACGLFGCLLSLFIFDRNRKFTHE